MWRKTLFNLTTISKGDFSMIKDAELLGVRMSLKDKDLLRRVAEINRLTMSDLARLILMDGLDHFDSRNFLSRNND
jgi:hypothetical protein